LMRQSPLYILKMGWKGFLFNGVFPGKLLESIEEVLVDGKPAALVRGGWNADMKLWENRGQLQLHVPHNGQTYIFSAMETSVSIDELIRIAESLP